MERWQIDHGESRIEDGGLKMVHRGIFRRSLVMTVSVLLIALLAFKTFAQEKVKFPIGESSKTLSYGPLWVAAKMGFFEREGLEVPIVTMRGSPLTIQALTADSIYVANATVDTLISAYERGADITMIGGLINGLGLSMIGGKSYKTYADLRGTTIGTQTLTSGTGFALRLVLKVARPGVSTGLQTAQHRQRSRSLSGADFGANLLSSGGRATGSGGQATGFQHHRLFRG